MGRQLEIQFPEYGIQQELPFEEGLPPAEEGHNLFSKLSEEQKEQLRRNREEDRREAEELYVRKPWSAELHD